MGSGTIQGRSEQDIKLIDSALLNFIMSYARETRKRGWGAGRGYLGLEWESIQNSKPNIERVLLLRNDSNSAYVSKSSSYQFTDVFFDKRFPVS